MFVALCAAATIGLGGMMPALASAASPPNATKQTVCQALDAGTDCSSDPNGVSLNSVIGTIVNIFSFVIGVVAVIMIIVAGYRYVVSGGDSSKVSTARSTITYALVGIVIAVMAQGLVRFVLNNLK